MRKTGRRPAVNIFGQRLLQFNSDVATSCSLLLALASSHPSDRRRRSQASTRGYFNGRLDWADGAMRCSQS